MGCHGGGLICTIVPFSNFFAGSAVEAAAVRKRSKYYAAIMLTYIFVSVAVETLGPVYVKGLRFLDQIGDRLSAVTGDPRELSFLYQRLSVLVQRFNVIAFREPFISETDTEVLSLQTPIYV